MVTRTRAKWLGPLFFVRNKECFADINSPLFRERTMILNGLKVLPVLCVLGWVCACSLLASDDKLPNSAVRIQYERLDRGDMVTGHGTAFGVNLSSYGFNGNRYMLSVSHNVLDRSGQPFSTLKVEINDGKRTFWTPCKVVAADPKVDICLLEAQDDIQELAELASKDIGPGESVMLEGSPRGIPITNYPGTIIERFHDGTISSLASIEFDHGDSGGPLFSAKSKKVVGIAVAGVPKNGDLDHTVGLFIPIVGIENFLEPHRRNFARIADAEGPPLRKTEVKRIAQVEVADETPAVMFVMPPKEVAPPKEVVQAKKEIAPVVASQPKAVVVPAVVASQPKAVVVPAVVASQPKAVVVPAVVVNQPKAALAPAVAEVKPAEARSAFVAPVTMATPAPAAPAASAPAAPSSYVVQSGDTLSHIAKRFNVKLKELIELNGIKDPNRIPVGSKLIISR
jgi:LysM repeat protein